LVEEEIGFMNKEGYTLAQPSPYLFTFVSKGKMGQLTKAVVFQEINEKLFNLVLLDRDEENNTWSDNTTSNNGDMPKVMVTVSQIIMLFLESLPEAKIYIEANSKSRNSLYHRILRNYQSEFELELAIEASCDGIIEKFESGKQYDYFYICKKNAR
jgi:hypothetical protein